MTRTRRSAVVLRDADPTDPADVAFLAELWEDSLRRGGTTERERDVVTVLERAAACPRERVLLAEQAGEPAGAVLLRLATVSALDLDPVVQVLAPTVVPQLRRRGVGQALVAAAVAFAEEHDAVQVATAARAGSREANRFMARLGFSQRATYRTAPVALLRSRAGIDRPDPASGARPVGRVLAARRSQRRAQGRPEEPDGPVAEGPAPRSML